MNEPKRRGRPPKLSTFQGAEGTRQIEPGEVVQFYRDPMDVSEAQAYALRVWAGQSVNVPYGERRWRVQKALEAQGMTMDGVVLPEAE